MTDTRAVRQKMVDGQIRPGDVTDLRIIEAMESLPRENFVADHQRATAYLDGEADIGNGRRMPKAIVVARLLQAANIGPSDDVMVVGCGTGYTAAVASRLAGRVLAVESDPVLVRRAQLNLAALAPNCTVVQGPLPAGDPANGRHNVIVVDGSVQRGLETLARQLADGGRLVGVLKGQVAQQVLQAVSQAVLVARAGDDIGQRALFDASAPLLPGFESAPAFVF